MVLSDLSETELKIIGECLKAAVNGPFFDDQEFPTLFGLTREEVKEVANRFPDVDEFDDEPTGTDDSWVAINNTLLNLTDYPHGKDAEWDRYISVPPQEVVSIFKKWKGCAT